MTPAYVVQPRDERGDGRGVLPVAGPQLVLLGIQVLLAAFARRRPLDEFIAAVHTPRWSRDRRQRGPEAERGRPAVLQGGVQDVRSVDPEIGPEPVDYLSL